jgi:hypothetical protein
VLGIACPKEHQHPMEKLARGRIRKLSESFENSWEDPGQGKVRR